MARPRDLAIRIALRRETLLASLQIAIVVGLLLNMINQGGAIISLELDHVSLAKGLFTFFVPFVVSDYSTTKAKLAFKIGDTAAVNVSVGCRTCGRCTAELQRGSTIPVCGTCAERTDWAIMDS